MHLNLVVCNVQVKTDRTVVLILAKKEEGPHWPRLLKAAGRAPSNVKVDWNRWVDEDEEGTGGLEEDGFDLSALQNLGGGGAGAGGMPDFSSLLGGAGGPGLEGLGAGEFGEEDDESGLLPAMAKGDTLRSKLLNFFNDLEVLVNLDPEA